MRKSLFASFEKTITSIEGRYELITYILAAREMLERETGMAAEGMTPSEVAEKAMDYWPAALSKGQRFQTNSNTCSKKWKASASRAARRPDATPCVRQPARGHDQRASPNCAQSSKAPPQGAAAQTFRSKELSP